MNAADPKKGAKIILKLLIVTWRPALRKNQGGPSNREKLRECFILDSGCTGWQNTPQNLLNINLPNLVGWLQKTLKSKIYFEVSLSNSKPSFSKKNKEHYQKKKKSTNVWYLILDALVATGLPNLIGWLQETLRKEQKLFRSDTFQLDSKFKKKNKEHYKKKKNSENALYLILSTLVGRARPKLWSISIYQTWFASCKRP